MKHSHTMSTHERQRISTGLQTQGELYRETNEGNEGDTAGATETMISNKMGGDRQSTWEHMAPNNQQAMCSTDRDIWWPAWAHQQDRDNREQSHNFQSYINVRIKIIKYILMDYCIPLLN